MLDGFHMVTLKCSELSKFKELGVLLLVLEIYVLVCLECRTVAVANRTEWERLG